MTEDTVRSGTAALLGDNVLEWRTYFGLPQVAEISRQWDELLQTAPCNRAFASREWYVASCEKQSCWVPFAAAGWRGNTLICIVPLVIDREDDTAKFPHHAADYNDAILRDADPRLAAELVGHAFAASGCQRMVLSKLRLDSCCARAFPSLCASKQFKSTWREIDSYHYASFSENFDVYLNSRSKRFRKDIRRTLRDLERNGMLTREIHADSFDPVALPELLIMLAVARHGTRCSFTRTEYVQKFLRDVLPPLFRNGHLRAFAMFQGERVVALDLCMVNHRGLSTWNGGFLPEMDRYSPGSALFAFEIQQAIACGLQELDFLRGEEAYKRSWTNSSYIVGELELSS